MRIFDKQKKLQDQYKRNFVQNWLASFLVVSVVVVVAVFQPQPASARFLRVEAVGTDIYYQMEVIDDSNTLSLDTLKIVAESSLDKVSYSSTLGFTSGSFQSLRPNAEYEISVRASKGYGEFALTKTKVRTIADYAGKILDARYNADNENDQEHQYILQIAYSDRKSELKSVYLSYTFTSFENSEIMIFPSIPITSNYLEFVLEGIPKVRGLINLQLLAQTLDDDIITLDTKELVTPYNFYTSIYVVDVGEKYISVSAFVETESEMDVLFFVNLFSGSRLIESITLQPYDEESHYSGDDSYIKFMQLQGSSDYQVTITARYFDDYYQQEVEIEIAKRLVKTAPPHTVRITSKEDNNFIDITIDFDVGFEMFTNMRYYVYYIENDMYYFVMTQAVVIEKLSEHHYQAILSIEKPNYEHYSIQVYIDKCIDDTTCYQWITLYEIKK